VYLVHISFTNRFGSPFSWDFQMETEDYAEAIDEARSDVLEWINIRRTLGRGAHA
jgi:hypothetical protein